MTENIYIFKSQKYEIFFKNFKVQAPYRAERCLQGINNNNHKKEFINKNIQEHDIMRIPAHWSYAH